MRGPISIAVSSAIGLATEVVAAIRHKDDKEEPHGDTAENIEEDADQDEWILDETQAQLETTDSYEKDGRNRNDVDNIVKNFLQDHPSPSSNATTSKYLIHPVIIPQRRPQSKSRGFVRAYAPALEGSGIDQKTFLDFLQGFDDSIKKESLFMITNVAVGIGSFAASTAVPSTQFFVSLAALAIHVTIETGRRMYMAKKLNTYLLDMNEHLFQPHGLYALIMAYKPKSSDAVEIVDLNLETSAALSAAHHGSSGSRFRIDSGATWDESQMPIAAPLIFPKLESSSEQQKQNAIKKASAFVSDYSDRRAQALFRAENPDSSLNIVPEKKFSSRYADPNHPVNKGGPLAILTGGKISFDNKKRERKEQENLAMGRPRDHGTGGIQRKMAENVLYLVIVNMPSEQQLEEAAAMEAEFKARQEE